MSRSFNKRAKQASSRAAAEQIPSPFSRAPASLQPFLERLNPAQVHITHIDTHQPDYKRNIFLIPVVLNGAIALLLIVRFWIALPQYFTLFETMLGYATPATVDPAKTTRGQQIWIVLRRTLMMAFDFLLFRFVGPWPLTFFLERPANPCLWRTRLGFQKEEVIVRVSRGWNNEDMMKGVKQGEENAFFKTRIQPAIASAHMRKTGYLMMDRSWDLEFELMLDAHTLSQQGAIQLEELDKLVFAHQDGVGWVTWKWESADDVVEGRRKQVVAFKEKLTAMGKESLFWRWTEIVEEERDLDGGFTPERQKRVAEKVQQEFRKEDVDFEAVIKSIGGLDEVTTRSG